MSTSDTGICTVNSLVNSLVARHSGRLRELVVFEKDQESKFKLN